MVIFQKIDEAIQTGVVIIVFLAMTAVLYLLWALSPKVLGVLLCVAGAYIFIYIPHIKAHQTERFIKSFLYIGAILFFAGLLLILFA